MKLITVKAALRTVLILAVISLSFIGSDCNKIIENVSNNGDGTLQGTWRLVYSAGTHDICPGENVEFQANGTALLSCPGNNQTITRNYTNSNNVLTYTETNIQYNIKVLTTEELDLEGVNNNRYLVYSRVTSGDKSFIPGQSINQKNANSSEK